MFAKAHVTGESSAIPREDSAENNDETAPINIEGDESDDDVELTVTAIKKTKLAKRRASSTKVDVSTRDDKNSFLREYKKAVSAHSTSVKTTSANKTHATTPSLKDVLVMIHECGATEGTALFYTASKLAMKVEYRELFTLIETKAGRLDWLQRVHDDMST